MNILELGIMSAPYLYVRWRWLNEADMEKVEEELKTEFHVERLTILKDDIEYAIQRVERYELKVTADTLIAFLSRIKASIFQKESAPFTKKDLELREKILELYPYSRPTVFPFFLESEPKFTVEK